VTRAEIERQLAALEVEVARIAPPKSDSDNPLAWAAWLTNDELEFAENVARLAVSGDDLRPAEYARWIEVQAGAIRRMLNGEPTDVEKSRAARGGRAGAPSRGRPPERRVGHAAPMNRTIEDDGRCRSERARSEARP
jgi:hypothetical protein